MIPPTSTTRKLVQRLKRRITPLYYEVVYGLVTPRQVNTMNFGYAPVTEALRPHYPSPDQGLQYELYYQTFNQLETSLTPQQRICEISSGRGGGLAFIRNLTAATVIGLERSPAARRYAARELGLDTRAATAPSLPLPSASVDVFLSVEAAHNYHTDDFIAEVVRCLKPGGYLLLADMNLGSDDHVRSKLTELYRRQGLILGSWRDIRPEVIAALQQDDQRKQQFMRFLFGPLRVEAEAYMGTVGSHKYHEMQRDERAYFILQARKPASHRRASRQSARLSGACSRGTR